MLNSHQDETQILSAIRIEELKMKGKEFGSENQTMDPKVHRQFNVDQVLGLGTVSYVNNHLSFTTNDSGITVVTTRDYWWRLRQIHYLR